MAALNLPDERFWAGKRVFLTGHTGFKGGWLSLWLRQLGANVAGFALAPDTEPNFFSVCNVEHVLAHRLGDIRDLTVAHDAMAAFAPEIVLHLAAQPLVRASYAMPVETFATNIIGTANVLDCVSKIQSIEVAVIVTSDKVYAESEFRHHEGGRLGGHDPYSASKAAAELVTAAFPIREGQRIATVRSGNVIGGGDWAADRLLPDFFRAIFFGETLKIRNPDAIRPWQHVLDPLCGYLLAAEALWHGTTARSAWNFGPDAASEVSVSKIAQIVREKWGDEARYEIDPPPGAPHEAPVLRLNSEKARRELRWRPGWNLDEALSATVAWFQGFQAGEDMAALTHQQIQVYCES